ncbi:hypothetical protein J3E69DRAFT_329920 [Trichoderma sp. SZMC 28015]
MEQNGVPVIMPWALVLHVYLRIILRAARDPLGTTPISDVNRLGECHDEVATAPIHMAHAVACCLDPKPATL